jgi:putative acetyltransferase
MLRPYRDSDLEDIVALWHRAWSKAYPAIDFTARLPWWRERLANELIPTGEVVVAEDQIGAIVGFVTLTPATGYLDQLVVAPEHQRRGLADRLMAYAKGRPQASWNCTSTRRMLARWRFATARVSL